MRLASFGLFSASVALVSLAVAATVANATARRPHRPGQVSPTAR